MSKETILRVNQWFAEPEERLEAARARGEAIGQCWEIWEKVGDAHLAIWSKEELDDLVALLGQIRAVMIDD